jgi:putative endonuclease
MKMNNRKTGNKGEQIAADFLANKGYEILERNYHNKWGEVDIVSRCRVKGENYVVFVEVKTKTDEIYGEPWEMINKHKLKQITQMGHLWCMENHYHGLLRIDVVGVWLDMSGEVMRVAHWENVQL